MDNENAVFIVIAAYNEAGTIATVVGDLKDCYRNVIVVDDGSIDRTAELAEAAGASVLLHVINRGQGAALQTGIQFALSKNAKVIVTFDADGQHSASDIAGLIAPVLRGECDVAMGSRFLDRRSNVPLIRKLTLKGGVLFTRAVSGIRVTDVHNGIRAFSRKAAESIEIKMDRMGHASEILDEIVRWDLNYVEVPVTVQYSDYSMNKGQSSWNAIGIALQFLLERVVK